MITTHPLALGLLFAAALLAFWLASTRWPPLFLLAAAYLTTTLPAAAPELPMTTGFKLTRVALLCLIILVAVVMRRRVRLGGLVWVLLVPLTFYAAAGLWSTRPEAAIAQKGLAVLTVLAGALTAWSCHPKDALTSPLRVLLVGALGCLGELVLYLLIFPAEVTRIGRLMPFSLNPNALGMTMATVLILCVAVALLDRSRAVRNVAYLGSAGAALTLLQTGSRGAVVEGLIGCAVLGATFTRRPQQVVTGVTILALSGLAFTYLAEDRAVERITSLDTPTREEIWVHALRVFEQNPVFGSGWQYNVRGFNSYGTRNLHNAYIQLLVESGVVGLAMFCAGLSVLVIAGLHLRRWFLRSSHADPSAGVALAVLLAVTAHGLVEAAPLMGTIDSFMLGFAVGLLDRARTIQAIVEHDAHPA